MRGRSRPLRFLSYVSYASAVYLAGDLLLEHNWTSDSLAYALLLAEIRLVHACAQSFDLLCEALLHHVKLALELAAQSLYVYTALERYGLATS